MKAEVFWGTCILFFPARAVFLKISQLTLILLLVSYNLGLF